jgi:predicted porin
MKKTLIAVAALVATGAFAQSTVQIDGIADAGVINYDYKGQKVQGVGANLTSTSQFNLRATNDLGGGLKATFRIETDYNIVSNAGNQGAPTNLAIAGGTSAYSAPSAGAIANQGAVATITAATAQNNGAAGTFGNGEVAIGLQGDFGTLKLGAVNTLGGDHVQTSQPFGTAVGGGYGALVFATPLSSSTTAVYRNDNTLVYTSPSFGGGFGIKYTGRKQQTSTSYEGNANFVNGTFGAQQQSAIAQYGLTYNNGPLNVVAARLIEDATNVVGISATPTAGTFISAFGLKGVNNNLAVNYAVSPALTLFAGYQGLTQSASNGAVAKQTSFVNLAAKYVMGANMFAANLGRLSLTTNAYAAASASSTLLALGYEYGLSKTTALTARYENIKDDAGVVSQPTGIAAATGTSRTRLGVGIRTAF